MYCIWMPTESNDVVAWFYEILKYKLIVILEPKILIKNRQVVSNNYVFKHCWWVYKLDGNKVKITIFSYTYKYNLAGIYNMYKFAEPTWCN